MEPGVIFLIFGGLVVILAVLGCLQSKRRRDMLRAWANEKGLHFCPDKVRGIEGRLGVIKSLQRGRNRFAYNVISGHWQGNEVMIFDYHYKTGSGKDSKRHRFSVVTLAPAFGLEPLAIRGEGFFDKVASAMGSEDINFESEEFSRKFHVLADRRKYAYDVLHNRSIEWVLQHPQYDVVFTNRVAAFAKSRRIFSPEEMEEALNYGKRLLDGIPSHAKIG